MANSVIRRAYRNFFTLPNVLNDTENDDMIAALPVHSYYMFVGTGGTGLIIGYKGTEVYQRQIRLTYFSNTVYSRVKNNSSTWSDWTAV